MARPVKQGFVYFPFDTSFFQNKKINTLRREFGSLGILTYINILCRVYDQGYAYRFTSVDELAADIAEEVVNGHLKNTTTQIREIIHHLMRHQMIDDRLFESGWITSVQMQEQYLDMAKTAKRKCVEIPDPLNLVGVGESIPSREVNSEETQVNSEETRVNSEFGTQSKVKKSNTTTTYSLSSRTREKKDVDCTPPSLTEVFAYFKCTLRVEDASTEARAFFLKNEEQWGWSCLPNWKAAAELWCLRGDIETDSY